MRLRSPSDVAVCINWIAFVGILTMKALVFGVYIGPLSLEYSRMMGPMASFKSAPGEGGRRVLATRTGWI